MNLIIKTKGLIAKVKDVTIKIKVEPITSIRDLIKNTKQIKSMDLTKIMGSAKKINLINILIYLTQCKDSAQINYINIMKSFNKTKA
jgi:hypothetical protein